jgi:hypothetical protein
MNFKEIGWNKLDLYGNGKVKVHPITGHASPEGE